MGPRLFSRGKDSTEIRNGDELMLQWGRDSSAAESKAWRRWATPRLGFNGAATLQPRKARNSKRHLPRRIMLQWGRDSSAAERPSANEVQIDLDGLQWGRDSSAAERTSWENILFSMTSGARCERPLRQHRAVSLEPSDHTITD